MTRAAEPRSLVEIARVSNATVIVPISGPYKKRAAKLKASPTEKLAATSLRRKTVTPLMAASAIGMSHAGSNGAENTYRSDSRIATIPAALTEHRYSLALGISRLI